MSQESQRFFKICFCFVLLYNKSLNDWSLGEQGILLSSNLNVSVDFVSGNKIHCSQLSFIKSYYASFSVTIIAQ